MISPRCIGMTLFVAHRECAYTCVQGWMTIWNNIYISVYELNDVLIPSIQGKWTTSLWLEMIIFRTKYWTIMCKILSQCLRVLATGSRCLNQYQHVKAQGGVTMFNPPITSSLRGCAHRSLREDVRTDQVIFDENAYEALVSSTTSICSTFYSQNVLSLEIAFAVTRVWVRGRQDHGQGNNQGMKFS